MWWQDGGVALKLKLPLLWAKAADERGDDERRRRDSRLTSYGVLLNGKTTRTAEGFSPSSVARLSGAGALR